MEPDLHGPTTPSVAPQLSPDQAFTGIWRIGMLRPLRIRDFAFLWTGLTISLMGDGLFLVAIAWQVFELSNTPVALSAVTFAWSLPMVVFLLVGGAVSDRFDRRYVMIAGDLIRAGAIGAMGVLVVTGIVEIWHLVVLAAVYGIGQAFFPPAFGSLPT
jgi:DHA3 family tetracycline resistance protein-like MFS transporter